VPVGAIYTTQPFAAMIESDRNNYHFEYVGKMDLAKNYGVRIYCTDLARMPPRPQPPKPPFGHRLWDIWGG
jgi:hypothetical protein